MRKYGTDLNTYTLFHPDASKRASKEHRCRYAELRRDIDQDKKLLEELESQKQKLSRLSIMDQLKVKPLNKKIAACQRRIETYQTEVQRLKELYSPAPSIQK